jgi:hypothetical protein
MTTRMAQIVWLWVRRRFICWHDWRTLKWYGLPNEPVLAQCRQCGLIAKDFR